MKKPSKQAIETAKTVIITILVTGIIAFIGGAKYQAQVNAQVRVQTVEVTSKQ